MITAKYEKSGIMKAVMAAKCDGSKMSIMEETREDALVPGTTLDCV